MSRFNRNEKIMLAVLAVPLLCLAMLAVYFFPPVYDRLAWRVEERWLGFQYWLNPPAEQVFVPQQAAGELNPFITVIAPDDAAPTATSAATLAAPASPTPTSAAALADAGTPTAAASLAPPATLAPTPTLPPPPPQAALSGVSYEDQHGRWNYCAPANLAMALSYWGWLGDRDVVGPLLKPLEKDKNVMPYEMVDYVTIQTQLRIYYHLGGDLDTLRRLIAGGFPVLVERGVYLRDLTGVVSWMGHYQVLTGYDSAAKTFTAQDSFVKANLSVPEDELLRGWRAFNYTYLLIYPPEREGEVSVILGPDRSPQSSAPRAIALAQTEIAALSGQDLFFAWFNLGSSHVSLDQYAEAAQAYDKAFEVYAALPKDDRPWRMLWYQTGPYYAYYHAGRYQDVIDLATRTLDSVQGEKNLEESYVWRARAYVALGNNSAAEADLMLALKFHPGFGPALVDLQALNQ